MLRTVGAVYVVLALYDAWFFALRGESTTFMQLMALLSAAAWLLTRPAPGWFRGWRAWLIGLGAIPLAVLVFVVLDHDSHSASDTLNRIVPSYALLGAVFLRLRHDGSLA